MKPIVILSRRQAPDSNPYIDRRRCVLSQCLIIIVYDIYESLGQLYANPPPSLSQVRAIWPFVWHLSHHRIIQHRTGPKLAPVTPLKNPLRLRSTGITTISGILSSLPQAPPSTQTELLLNKGKSPRRLLQVITASKCPGTYPRLARPKLRL